MFCFRSSHDLCQVGKYWSEVGAHAPAKRVIVKSIDLVTTFFIMHKAQGASLRNVSTKPDIGNEKRCLEKKKQFVCTFGDADFYVSSFFSRPPTVIGLFLAKPATRRQVSD